jgi:hypothetical protein
MVSLSVAAVGGRLLRGDLTRCINVDLSFDLSETPSLAACAASRKANPSILTSRLDRSSPEGTVNSGGARNAKADVANCYASAAVLGRNSITAMTVIRMKIANTTACVTANGGSDWVGANALRAETFAKLCATRTNTFK